MKQDREMLAEHGTKLMTLAPSSIVSAARADLRRAERNAEHWRTGDGSYEHYAFHRKHVKKAKTSAELIALAAAEPAIGAESSKYNTRLIYSDTSLLEAAKALA